MNSEQLKQRRISLNLTQAQLAKALKKSRKTINSYENGANIPQDVQIMIEMYFDKVTKGDFKKVTSTEDRFEDIITKKVLSELEPYFDKMIEAIAKMDIELTRIRILQEDTKEKVDSIEKRQ